MDRRPSPRAVPPRHSAATYELYARTFRPPRLHELPALDAELQMLVYLVLRDFVGTWYTGISGHDDFYAEVVKTLCSVVSSIQERLAKIDVVQLAMEELPILLAEHVRNFRESESLFGTLADGGAASVAELFQRRMPHPGMSSREAMLDHLRAIVDLGLHALLPASEVGAEALRLLVREAITVPGLAGMLERFSEPDFIADAVLKLLAALDASGGEEVPLETEKPKARRPWHRVVSSQTVQPVVVRQLHVLASSGTEKPAAPSPPPRTFLSDLLSAEAWSERLSGAAFAAAELLNTAARALADAAWRFLTQPAPPSPSKSFRREQYPPINRTESDPMPAEYPWEEDEIDFEVTEQLQEGSSSVATSRDLAHSEVLDYGGDQDLAARTPIFATLHGIYLRISAWRRAAAHGPFAIGPISDTRVYSGKRVYGAWLELGGDILGLRERGSHGTWVWDQLRYAAEPLFIWFAGKDTLKRAALELLAGTVSGPRFATYLRLLRASMWPNGELAKGGARRSDEEKAALSASALTAVRARLAPALSFVLGDSYLDTELATSWRAFQNPAVVRHLLLRIVDALVLRLFAEELEAIAASEPKLGPAAHDTAPESLSPEQRPTIVQTEILSGMNDDIRAGPFVPSSPVKAASWSQPSGSPVASTRSTKGILDPLSIDARAGRR
ncbi:PXA domain-containing protein [Hyaloraphidium curvatum]|nr:PXA domain-containing protein [Hyaloraphidium curvatum]